MPKDLEKDATERGLHRLRTTQEYCVRATINGKERFQNLKTKNRKEAIRLKDRLLAEWACESEPGQQKRVLFRVVATKLLEIYNVKAKKTFDDYCGHVKLHLLPFFDNRYLDEVGPLWSQYKAHEKHINPNRKLTHDRKHALRILRHAYDQELISRVPKLELDLEDRHVDPGRVYSIAEYRRLHAAANPKWKLIIELAAIMGMRRGEIFNLKWEQVDLEAGMINLPGRSVKTRQGRVFRIEKLILLDLAARKSRGVGTYVFPNRENVLKPMCATDRTWRRIKKRAGVSGKFHWLRHSNVTWSLKHGHSPTVIGKAIGMSPKVLDRVYAHADSEDAGKLSEEIRRMLSDHGRNNPEQQEFIDGKCNES